MYTKEAVVTFQILVDQYQWAAYWTLALAMGAVVVLGLKDRVLPRWYAWLSAVLTAFVLGMTLVLALPYSAGVVAPVWLVATTVVLLRPRIRLADAAPTPRARRRDRGVVGPGLEQRAQHERHDPAVG